ncbi:hypothetical protein [Aeoliella sp. SH292]|uniref:hypothetical protein n=1 Tax=Aeoliella sp. SH292 TaxID=3454464 RepID=UPI003F946792
MCALIPPADAAPPSINHLPVEKRVELWYELLDEADALVKSGLRHRIGPDGDLQQAYREWYARQMQQHDQEQFAMLRRLAQCEASHGG